MRKIIIFMALCVLMLIQLPVSAAPADSGTCGENVLWSIASNGTLTVRGRGAMDDYNQNNAPWIRQRMKISRVQIEYGVTRIGTNAFAKSLNLTDVIIAGSVRTIGEAAFSDCANLAEVFMDDGVSEIEKNAFNACKALDTLTLSDSLRVIGQGAFANCENLQTIDIPSGVTALDAYAFRNCLSLKRVSLPENLTEIGTRTFSRCEELSELALPRRISSIGAYAFENCASLRTVDIPAGVTVISQGTFYNSGLESVSLPNGIMEIESYAFRGCDRLTDVYYAAGESRWNSISMNDFRTMTGTQDIQVHFGENAPAQMPAQIKTLTVSAGRATVQITGNVEEDSKLILAAYDSGGKLLDISTYPVYQSGQYTDYLSTTGAQTVTAFLVSPDGRPSADSLSAQTA